MRGSRMVVYDVFDVTHRMISVQFLLLLCVPSQLLLVGPADRLRTAYLRTPSINTEERTKNKKKNIEHMSIFGLMADDMHSHWASS